MASLMRPLDHALVLALATLLSGVSAWAHIGVRLFSYSACRIL